MKYKTFNYSTIVAEWVFKFFEKLTELIEHWNIYRL